MPWNTLLLAAAGGAVGSGLRVATGWWLAPPVGHSFATGALPWGTLSVNLAGCFLIGLFTPWATGPQSPAWVGPALLLGLLGGFTIFSSFGIEFWRLLEAGRSGSAIGYVLASNAGGMLLVGLGLWLGRSAGSA